MTISPVYSLVRRYTKQFLPLVVPPFLLLSCGGTGQGYTQKSSARTPAARYPCETRSLSVCTDNPGDSPICQLIKGPSEESTESLNVFFSQIKHLDRNVREDLTCARFFGAKTFELISLSPLWGQEYKAKLDHDELLVEDAGFYGLYYYGLRRSTHRDFRGSTQTDYTVAYPYVLWDIQFLDSNFPRIVENHLKMIGLKDSQHSDGGFTVSFSGFVERIQYQYKARYREGQEGPKDLIAAKIVVRNAQIEQIATSAGRGSSAEVLAQSSAALKKAYDRYMGKGGG